MSARKAVKSAGANSSTPAALAEQAHDPVRGSAVFGKGTRADLPVSKSPSLNSRKALQTSATVSPLPRGLAPPGTPCTLPGLP